jgi:hypothetical protein
MARRAFKVSGTFDIETSSWNVFCLGAVYDGHLPKLFYDGNAMLDHMRRAGGTWWSHAGGVFDNLYMLELARQRGIACAIDRAQHRVSRVVMGPLELRDSYGLWPVPLDDICGSIGRPVPRLPWRCTCSKRKTSKRGCNGYCRIPEKAREGDPDLEAYVVADCRALYDGLVALEEFTATHRIALRGTLGQTAWIAAQDELGVPDSEISWHCYRHARKGDRGGRSAIIRPKAEGPGSHHDICNAYPAQLAHADLPVGDPHELGERHALRALRRARPGMYTCTVVVPDTLFLPPLPWMHGGQLNFPVGRFAGTWTLPELVAAIERGVVLEKVHSALIWEGTAPVFADLVQRWYEIRRKVGRKTPHGQWIGRLAKALTGKFAERPDRSRVTMYPDEIKVCLRKGKCRDGCTFRCGAYEPIDLDGFIWAIPFSHLGPSAYPQWSSYLRAMTRVQWLEQAERYGEDLCFGNTDSLWTIGRAAPEPLGDGLGEWELQNLWCDLEVRSATTYAWRELANEPVLDKVASLRAGRAVYTFDRGALHTMGIPGITEADWKRGRGILDRGIVTFGRAVGGTRGLFTRRHRRWTLPQRDRQMYGDRKLATNGVTYPVDARELRELFAARQASLKARGDAKARARMEAANEDNDPDPDKPIRLKGRRDEI